MFVYTRYRYYLFFFQFGLGMDKSTDYNQCNSCFCYPLTALHQLEIFSLSIIYVQAKPRTPSSEFVPLDREEGPLNVCFMHLCTYFNGKKIVKCQDKFKLRGST